MALSMVLESIVAVFGFFSAFTGVIVYFVVPICLIVQYPKVKKENIYMDHLQAGDTTVDPVLVGVLAIVSPTISDETIQRVRTLSNKIFGPAVEAPVDANQPQRTLSFLRPRALSISISEDGVEKIISNSMIKRDSTSHDVQIAKEQVNQIISEILEVQAEEESSVTVEENIVNAGTGKITKFRKILGIFGIIMLSLVCGVGVYMNGVDMVEQFV
ncbi:Amino_acid transporter family protein [Hexamita inflata]|uniref:Amino acid transporter family protein n=1 Tax=Hexamita inflata TaxID=28002 RepID=A0AA86URF2_9EUKA|nr:Amino acid transporter family protein [Hexamita inflata]